MDDRDQAFVNHLRDQIFAHLDTHGHAEDYFNVALGVIRMIQRTNDSVGHFISLETAYGVFIHFESCHNLIEDIQFTLRHFNLRSPTNN